MRSDPAEAVGVTDGGETGAGATAPQASVEPSCTSGRCFAGGAEASVSGVRMGKGAMMVAYPDTLAQFAGANGNRFARVDLNGTVRIRR